MSLSSTDSLGALSYQIMDSEVDSESSWITVMCRASRFQITISLKDLRGSCFELEYSELVAKVDDMDGGADDDYEALCSWLVKPCLSYFRECTLQIPTDITFEAFYYPTTHYMKLIVSGASLYPKATRDRHTLNPLALMIPSRDIPQHPRVCYSKASDIQIVPATTEEAYDYMSELPRKALIGDGTIKFFKPAIDKRQIICEISTHSRIISGGLKNKIRVANIHSIVISKDGKMTIGLLFDLIPSIGESLQSLQCKLAVEHHTKWREQVTAIINELHCHDIVWGDVHPGNIVIDKNFDAWVVDFGGGWIEEFVQRKKAGTKEGDWQGLRKIFEEWITR